MKTWSGRFLSHMRRRAQLIRRPKSAQSCSSMQHELSERKLPSSLVILVLDKSIEKLLACLARTSKYDAVRLSVLTELCDALLDRYFERGSKEDVRQARRLGIEALNILEESALNQEGTRFEPAQIPQIARQIARCCLEFKDYEELIVALERGKAVRMRDRAMWLSASTVACSDTEVSEALPLRARLRKVTADILAFDSRSPELKSDATQETLAGLRAEERALRRRLSPLEGRATVTDLMGNVRRHLAEAENDAFVFLTPMDAEGLLVVVLSLSGLSSGLDQRDVFYVKGWGRRELNSLLFADSSLGDATDGWLSSYWASRGTEQPAQGGNLWHDVLSDVLKKAGEEVMEPLFRRLNELGIARVVLIPGDRLVVLPLHAAPIASGRRRFHDEFLVSYAPSICLFLYAEQCQALEGDHQLVGVCNPDGSLPFAEMQMRMVARTVQYPVDILYGDDCSRAGIIRRAERASVLALSTHAYHVLDRPEKSAFVVQTQANSAIKVDRAGVRSSADTLITLHDILRGDMPIRPGAVVVADACETGSVQPDMIVDEMFGFPAAFIAFGASSVVSTFWAVSDFSTAILMS